MQSHGHLHAVTRSFACSHTAISSPRCCNARGGGERGHLACTEQTTMRDMREDEAEKSGDPPQWGERAGNEPKRERAGANQRHATSAYAVDHTRHTHT